MKKLANLNGVKKISTKEQKSISGGFYYGSCTQQGSICCQTYPSGFILCEPGRCGNYGCFWY